MAALALEFAILTCVRSTDVVNAKHADVDRAARMWVIPAFSKTRRPSIAFRFRRRRWRRSTRRAKSRRRDRRQSRQQRVCISQRRHRSAIFRPIRMLGVIERMGRKGAATTHGFRASFRTWAQEQTNFPWELSRDVARPQGRHARSSAPMRAATRFKKRVAIMQAWADYCGKPQQAGKVIPLQSRRGVNGCTRTAANG